MRFTRLADGKSVEVPSDMQYEEWKREYVTECAEKPEKLSTAGQKVLTNSEQGGIIKGGKVYKFEEYLSNPSLLAESTPKQKFDFFVNNGNRVIPYLGRGNFKKIPYYQGGGFRVFFDENEEYLLQYHPEERSHHKGAYYKLSGGGKPKRYKLDGTEIVD